ncbi:hypothetical protein DF209_20625, partial [Pectobacterium polaris]
GTARHQISGKPLSKDRGFLLWEIGWIYKSLQIACWIQRMGKFGFWVQKPIFCQALPNDSA